MSMSKQTTHNKCCWKRYVYEACIYLSRRVSCICGKYSVDDRNSRVYSPICRCSWTAAPAGQPFTTVANSSLLALLLQLVPGLPRVTNFRSSLSRDPARVEHWPRESTDIRTTYAPHNDVSSLCAAPISRQVNVQSPGKLFTITDCKSVTTDHRLHVLL